MSSPEPPAAARPTRRALGRGVPPPPSTAAEETSGTGPLAAKTPPPPPGSDAASPVEAPEPATCDPNAPDVPNAPAPDERVAPQALSAPPAPSAPKDPAAGVADAPPLAADPTGAGSPAPASTESAAFTVVLDNFEGPFDLLLQLISKHKLDVTEVALSRVTDEFMAHIRAMGPDWDLDQTTEFLVVAATLLDLKAARLLPSAEVEDEADLALLEARDLLFARLLQYRAYKRVADIFADRLAGEARRFPRTVGLEPHHAELLPDVVIRIGPEGFARLAVKAMRPKPRPRVYIDHIHAPLVSVREQAEVIVTLLRTRGAATFAELTADAGDTLTVVARFLALLELYRERAVTLDQDEALGALTVHWSGAEDAAPRVTDEFDRQPQPEDGAGPQEASRQ